MFLYLMHLKTNRLMNRFIVLLAVVLLAGCRVGPKYHKPRIPLPEQWKMAGDEAVSEEEEEKLSAWWEAFEDPVLNALIERGLCNNPDIAIAAQRILEERALYFKAKADLYPSIYLGGGRPEAFTPSQGIFLGQQSFVNLLNTQNVKIQRHLEFYQLGPSVYWEIDLFGRIRSAMDAQGAEWQSAFENMRGVRIALAADIARNYIDLRGYQAELAIENEYLVKLQERLKTLQSRLQLRLATLDEIAGASGDISEANIILFNLQKSIEETKQRLAALLGEFDLPVDLDFLPSPSVPRFAVEPYAGIPSDLLCQRPDIIQAERELAAATYRVGSITAEGLPSFEIIGTIGGLSEQIAKLFEYKNLYWFYDPFIGLPIFDGGRNKAAVASMRARANAAFARYRKTLLIAVEEVQIALYALNFEKMRFEEKMDEVLNYDQAYQRHMLLYRKGNADFRALANAEDNYYLRKRESVQFEIAVSLNFVTLSKALGGYSVRKSSE